MQPVAQRRYVGRNLDLDAGNRIPAESAFPAFKRRGAAKRAGAFGIGSANVEMRTLSVVSHQERAAVFESAVQMDDGHRSPSGRETTR